jgi:hypothetical protein
MVGQKKFPWGSRSPNDTQKNGAGPLNRKRMGGAHSGVPSFVIWPPQNQSRDPYEDGDEEAWDNHDFHDNLRR